MLYTFSYIYIHRVFNIRHFDFLLLTTINDISSIPDSINAFVTLFYLQLRKLALVFIFTSPWCSLSSLFS
jgi:hypothetical protein